MGCYGENPWLRPRARVLDTKLPHSVLNVETVVRARECRAKPSRMGVSCSWLVREAWWWTIGCGGLRRCWRSIRTSCASTGRRLSIWIALTGLRVLDQRTVPWSTAKVQRMVDYYIPWFVMVSWHNIAASSSGRHSRCHIGMVWANLSFVWCMPSPISSAI